MWRGHRLMRTRVLIGVGFFGLTMAGCSSEVDERSSEDLKTFDVSEEAPSSTAPSPPGIVPTAAPGVAFNYRYGFRLPDANISAAQEAHAAACEKLGLTRCRITGMTYRLDDRDRVDATLALSIDPLLARSFGRDAIAFVEKSDGRLRYAEITGEDQNPVLDEAARRQGNASTSIGRLDADLAKAKSENERVQIREQIRQLRAEIDAAQSTAAESEAKIQRTPMTFNYAGGGASGRGFAGENPAAEAWYLFVDSLATMVSVGLKLLAIALPWLVLIAALVALARSRLMAPVRRWWRNGGSTPEQE
jgi:hypothetical protein